jgi:hypothetical protein
MSRIPNFGYQDPHRKKKGYREKKRKMDIPAVIAEDGGGGVGAHLDDRQKVLASSYVYPLCFDPLYTDKKENEIFLIF